jgi:hypothetical protein
MRVPSVLQADIRHAADLVPVHDLSFGGFSIVSAAPHETGTLHRCDLLPVHAPPVTLLAQVVRSDHAPGSSHFITGFRFSMIEPHSRQDVNGLIDSVARSLGFEPPAHQAPGTRH